MEEYKSRCHSPYSGINVVCELVGQDESHFGVNVESASYGLTICAERNAIFSAITKGVDLSGIKEVRIVANMNHPRPCGACAQILSELLPSTTAVVCGDYETCVKIGTVKDLLPHQFQL